MSTIVDGTTGVSLVQDGVVVNADIVSVASSKITGTTTNDNAAAGVIGEYLSAQRLLANANPVTTGTGNDATSLTLTPGDWDVSGMSGINFGTGANVTVLRTSLSLTSATINLDNGIGQKFGAAGIVPQDPLSYTVPMLRVSVAVNTSVFLVARVDFTGGTAAIYGNIQARRVR